MDDMDLRPGAADLRDYNAWLEGLESERFSWTGIRPWTDLGDWIWLLIFFGTVGDWIVTLVLWGSVGYTGYHLFFWVKHFFGF